MINIEICPAHSGNSGWYRATGHAQQGHEDVCMAVTVIADCLAANLDGCWNIRASRRANDGVYDLRWNKTDRQGKGLRRANDAAGFAYNGLRRLAKAWHDDLTVVWKRPEMVAEGGKRNENR